MTAATLTSANVLLADRRKLDVDQPHCTAESIARTWLAGACVQRLQATTTEEN